MISEIRFIILRYKKSDSSGGFSLLEVLISIAIFTIALLAISVMLLNTIKGNTISIHLTNASQLASMQIEEMMLMRYSDLRDMDSDAAGGLDDHDPATADMSKLAVEAGGTGKLYNIYTNVAEDYPVKRTKTIRVIVAWKHGERDKHTKFDFVRTPGE
jgi:prepilin-type N-terminal cleavage/methylation domain-containing protein